jgi:hypothetical protein
LFLRHKSFLHVRLYHSTALTRRNNRIEPLERSSRDGIRGTECGRSHDVCSLRGVQYYCVTQQVYPQIKGTPTLAVQAHRPGNSGLGGKAQFRFSFLSPEIVLS